VILIVPVEVAAGRGEGAAGRGLADLARSRHQDHLAVLPEMLGEQPLVESRERRHRPDRMLGDRNTVKTILR
jgi:hypothetical protein